MRSATPGAKCITGRPTSPSRPFAVVADPQGVAFNLLTPKGPEQPQPAAGTPGTIGWRELYSTDWEKGFDFYSKQFGWGKASRWTWAPWGSTSCSPSRGSRPAA